VNRTREDHAMNKNTKKTQTQTQIQDLQPAEHEQPAQQPRELSESELRLAAGGCTRCSNCCDDHVNN